MKKLPASLALCAACVVALGLGPAQAKVFDFNLTDLNGDVAAGQLDAVSNGSTYTITSISGTWEGTTNSGTISGLSSYAGADQLLYPTAPYADFSGISFTVNSVSYNWSNYAVGTTSALGGIAVSTLDPNGYGAYQIGIATVTVTAVPEAATWLMMLGGFSALGLIGSRRKNRHSWGELGI
ncbi:PEP-CTERM sorting domain-containing protein [Rhodoblastus sp.]|uniref:PEP-CTERM sorting domain-containing protein n=1 Tax=Rhodoblastus sp. TaxID=1962975 RepID=UPI003F98F6B1